MAGALTSGPTPWWQLPEYAGSATNLSASAPAGYTYDPVSMGYRPIAGSPTDILAQRSRVQSIEDAARVRQQAYEDSQRSAADQMRARLFDMLNSTSSASTVPVRTGGSSGVGSVSFGYPAIGAPLPAAMQEVAPVALPDNSAAAAATFARAKDQVGAETAGSMTALRSALAARGMLGGGGERRGVTNILTKGQGELGDTTRTQAVSDVNRATDFAKMGYEGAITQRGQDVAQRGQTIGANDAAAGRALSAATTSFEGGIQERGQDISSADAAAARATQAQIAANAARNASVNTLISRLY